MLINDILKSSLEGEASDPNKEHPGSCGCAFCMPSNLDRITLIEPAPIVDQMVAVDEDSLITNSQQQVDNLLSSASALEQMVITSSMDAGILRTTINAVVGEDLANYSMPSMESFRIDYERSLVASVESIGEMLERVWEAIKRVIRNVYNAIMDFFKRIFSTSEKVVAKSKRNQVLIGALKVYDRKEGPTEAPADIKLSRQAVKMLSIYTNKHYALSSDLIKDIGRYIEMYERGFSKYINVHINACDTALKINKTLIETADAELDRGQKRDERIAQSIISKAKRMASDAFGAYGSSVRSIRDEWQGNYLGGLVVSLNENPTMDTELFSIHETVRATVVEGTYSTLPTSSIEAINSLGSSLAKAHSAVMENEYAEIQRLITEITDTIDTTVKNLKDNYSDYPVLLKAFRSNLDNASKNYNTLLRRLYVVVKNTNELASAIVGEFVPAQLAAHGLDV